MYQEVFYRYCKSAQQSEEDNLFTIGRQLLTAWETIYFIDNSDKIFNEALILKQ